MTEIRALVVDDEPLARRGVVQLLAGHGDVRLVGEARNGGEAVRLMETLRPDLVFLDVEMPGTDGFGVLARTAGRPAVVFLTAYEEFAVRAFDAEAVDYLVKPPTRERFDRALERVREWLRSRGREAHGEAGDVVVEDGGAERRLRAEEIDCVEAADYYAAVHAGGRRFLVRESLDALEARLPDRLFCRAHRSALVNLARVESWARDGGGGVLRLRSGAEVRVSRRRWTEVVERLRGRPRDE